MSLGAELDGSIKYEFHGKVTLQAVFQDLTIALFSRGWLTLLNGSDELAGCSHALPRWAHVGPLPTCLTSNLLQL